MKYAVLAALCVAICATPAIAETGSKLFLDRWDACRSAIPHLSGDEMFQCMWGDGGPLMTAPPVTMLEADLPTNGDDVLKRIFNGNDAPAE